VKSQARKPANVLDTEEFNQFITKHSVSHPNIVNTTDEHKTINSVDYIFTHTQLDDVFIRTPIFDENTSPNQIQRALDSFLYET
jgi:hypothetical protein